MRELGVQGEGREGVCERVRGEGRGSVRSEGEGREGVCERVKGEGRGSVRSEG